MPRGYTRSPALQELKRMCKQQVGQLGMIEKRFAELRHDPDRDVEQWEKLKLTYKLNRQTLTAYQNAYRHVEWAERNT